MIQQWQKELLETAFANHQYPTVHQYEALSKQLELPHYVTKVGVVIYVKQASLSVHCIT